METRIFRLSKWLSILNSQKYLIMSYPHLLPPFSWFPFQIFFFLPYSSLLPSLSAHPRWEAVIVVVKPPGWLWLASTWLRARKGKKSQM